MMTDIRVDEVPEYGNAARVRAYKRRDTERHKKNVRKYRHDNSKWMTDKKYLSRPFVAWDGEGITRTNGSHDYVMCAVKGEGVDADIFSARGISTAQMLEFVITNSRKVPNGINVIYGGGYDFNMWLRDVPRHLLEILYKNGSVNWQNYRLTWRRGKSFTISLLNDNGKTRESVTIYDCASFFQCPFVQACDSYLGDEFVNREMIVANKALRSSFTNADVAQMRIYNDAELTNLIKLMEELRKRLNKCGLRPRRWDGPGAVASALLSREGIKQAMAASPDAVAQAARYAYAGGRFEVLRFGSVHGAVYEYDINSAYPAALLNVPDLTNGKWRHVKGDAGPHRFALYHVEYRGTDAAIPGALFRRDANGTICYPLNLTGWYWTPEIETAREYCKRGHGEMRIIETWVFDEYTDARPFAFVDRLYRMREVFKAQGDGAHVGIKLGLNSLYGKMAQQLGARRDLITGEWRIPPFHQIEWAGYVTSWCRAHILRACLDNLEDVIAFETDAVFLSAPLNVPQSSKLGEFKETQFSRLTYLQSGMYFGESDGEQIEKTRGIDRDTLHESDVIDIMARPKADDRFADAKMTRFIGIGVALAQSFERWRKWETTTKRVNLEPSGKRIHAPYCPCNKRGLEREKWHLTMCPMMGNEHSHEFPIAWINPNPEMNALEEMRADGHEWSD